MALLKDFFSPDEVAEVQADFQTVFGRTSGAQEPIDRKKGQAMGHFNEAQFKRLNTIPFNCAPALNLIGVQPA